MFVFMALYPVAMEVSAGNVNLLIAAAVVVGFRYPASWAFVLLTKVTPGIGLVWFAVRKEWRSLAIATGATALLIGISLVFVPQLWPEWFATVTSEVGADSPGAHVPIPLVIRLPIAGALVAWGARTDRRWVVPIAVTLAVPTIWPAVLSILVGSFALSTIHRDDVPARPRSVDLDPGRIAVPIQAEVDAGS